MYWKKYFVIPISVVFLCLAGCSEAPTVHGGTDFAGSWVGSAQKTGSANPTMRLTIQQDGEVIGGTLSTLDGTFTEVTIADVRLENGRLLFHAVANGGDLFKDHLFVFSLAREGKGIHGTWTDLLEGAEGPLLLESSPD